VFGLDIGLRINVDAPGLLDDLRALLVPSSPPSDSGPVDVLYSLIVGREPSEEQRGRRFYHVLYMNATRVARTMDWSEIRERLRVGGRMLIAQNARGSLFVSAGVVAARDRAIVITGLDQIARTALVTALVRAGATYLSGEYAPISMQTGAVVPFANLLPFRAEADQVATEQPIEALGGVAEDRRLPIGMVIAATYRPGRPYRQRALSQGQAMLHLMASTVVARRRPAEAFDTFGTALAGASALEVAYGDPDEAAARIMEQGRA
jgi:hypothetical protein